MWMTGIVFAALMLAVLAERLLKDVPLNIIGGDSIYDIRSRAFQVYLKNAKDNLHCGGVIISSKHVLTAHHCVADESTYNLLIYAGDIMKGRGTLHTVLRKIEPRTMVDIVILKISPDFMLDDHRKIIQLPGIDEKTADGTPVELSGWGGTEPNGIGTTILRSISLPFISRDKCLQRLTEAEKDSLRVTEFCVGEPGKTTTVGDSGGPVTVNKILVGIITAGPKHTNKYLTFAVQISKHMEWISSIITPKKPVLNWMKRTADFLKG